MSREILCSIGPHRRDPHPGKGRWAYLSFFCTLQMYCFSFYDKQGWLGGRFSICQDRTFYSDSNLLFASWEVIGACSAGKCVTRNYAWSSCLNRKLISNLCAIITHLRNHKSGWICGEAWIVPASETLITSFSKTEQANTKLPNKNRNHTLAYPHTYRHHQSLSDKWNNDFTVAVGKVSVVQEWTALKWVVHLR